MITEKLDRLISKSSDELGVTKAEYVKSLVLRDLRKSILAVEGSGASSRRGEK